MWVFGMSEGNKQVGGWGGGGLNESIRSVQIDYEERFYADHLWTHVAGRIGSQNALRTYLGAFTPVLSVVTQDGWWYWVWTGSQFSSLTLQKSHFPKCQTALLIPRRERATYFYKVYFPKWPIIPSKLVHPTNLMWTGVFISAFCASCRQHHTHFYTGSEGGCF